MLKSLLNPSCPQKPKRTFPSLFILSCQLPSLFHFALSLQKHSVWTPPKNTQDQIPWPYQRIPFFPFISLASFKDRDEPPWWARKCLINSFPETKSLVLICSTCQFPWCKYSHCGRFQTTKVGACKIPEYFTLSFYEPLQATGISCLEFLRPVAQASLKSCSVCLI